MKRYERWTVRLAGGKRATFNVAVERERADRVVGVKVDKEGDEIGGERGQRHIVIAAPRDIVRRIPLVFDRKYGTLELV